eukprot:gene7665-1096_t
MNSGGATVAEARQRAGLMALALFSVGQGDAAFIADQPLETAALHVAALAQVAGRAPAEFDAA